MKYMPLRATDVVSHMLNFSTSDCHIVGSCEIYTIKAAKCDKELYKAIDAKLEQQHETLVRASVSMSPTSEEAKGGEKDGRGKRGSTQESTDMDFSSESPFGSFGQHAARRTFTYFIATLNASHDDDYDFSYTVKPSNFHKEMNIYPVINDVDNTMRNLRPRQTAIVKRKSPPMYSTSAPSMSGLANEVWNMNCWRLIDEEMRLLRCDVYTFTPPFDDEVGTIWSKHYFFYNKLRKRVCYLYFRAYSIISHSPTAVLAPWSRSRNGRNGSFSPDTRDDEDMSGPDNGDDEDEVDVSYMDVDDLRAELAASRHVATYDDDDDEWEHPAHQARVRGMSEEIGAAMEMDT